ncbi:hypothetical protein MJO29_015371, partial [Puccinia striiformis f. sp. tritici]
PLVPHSEPRNMTTFTSLIQTPALSYQEIMMPTSCAMMIGFASGATTSGKLAGYQFMVENLHRLPRTRANWFFFQKTKNYKVILGGFKGGLKTGGKLGAWTAGFCTLKELFTLLPAIERRKSIAGALAGLNMALGASLFYQLRPTISPRRLLLGTLMGLCAGLAEDMKAHLEEEDPPL